MRQTLRVMFVVSFCVLLVSGIGCTRSRRIKTRASGDVTVNGQPLTVGKITFRPTAGGQTYTDTITRGRYAVRSRSSMPAGQYEVTIDYSSRNDTRGGFDRHHTEHVTVGPLGTHHTDFHL